MLPDDGAEVQVHDLADGYRLVVSARDAGRSTPVGAAILSRSAAGGRQAVLAVVGADRAGLDMETPGRIAANARADDGWLSPAERVAIRDARSPTTEIACRWMLKEAYGKALGVGLALPLAALTFRGEGHAIALVGTAAPPASERWAFMLLSLGETLFAVAARPSAEAVRTRGQEAAATAA